MASVVSLLFFYGLALLSGTAIASRAAGASLLARILTIFTAGCAQILIEIQLLSLVHQLREIPLFAVHAGLTALVLVCARRPLSKLPVTWLPSCRLNLSGVLSCLKRYPISTAMLAISITDVVIFSFIGFMVLAAGDTYHFAMPLFWRQHATVLPFAATNPRFVSLVFASEALCFPGVLYANTLAMFYIVSAIAKLLSIWVVTAIALRLGASQAAAICAGAVLIGYSPLAGWSPDPLLAGMWFTAGIFFLLEAKEDETAVHRNVGLSLFCALLACGSKNVVVLQMPFYLLFAAALLGRDLFSWRLMKTIAVAGLLGLLCSTFLWNFVSNRLWFGNSRGPQVVRDTVSTDFRPQAIWTRIIRETVHSFGDPMWLPGSLRDPYGTMMKRAVQMLGGREFLDEDKAEEAHHAYSFTGDVLQPGSGLGLLGLLVFAPGLVLAAMAPIRFSGAELPGNANSLAWRRFALAMLTAGSFVIFYTVLRTQRIGVTRLMVSCIVAGAPLAACLFERRGARAFGGVILCACLGIFAFSNVLSMTLRVPGFRYTWLGAKADGLLRKHTAEVQYVWSGEQTQRLTLRYPASPRELYLLLMTRVPPSSVIGSVSGDESEDVYLFGPDFSNQVLCLRDGRALTVLLPIPPKVQYIVCESGDTAGMENAFSGFSVWLEVFRDGRRVFAAWKRS